MVAGFFVSERIWFAPRYTAMQYDKNPSKKNLPERLHCPHANDPGLIHVTSTIDNPRRRFLGTAALGLLIAPFSLNAIAATVAPRATKKATPPQGATSFRALKQIKAGLLDVGYAEDGPAHGTPVVLLHGWPYDIHSYVDVAPILAAAGYRVIVPYLRGYGTTRFLSPDTPRNGEQAVIAVDIIALMDALKIGKAIVAGYDWGARTADILAALWPARCKALVSVSGYLVGSQEQNAAPIPPKGEQQWWYQYYFATARGEAGYAKYTHDFARLIWEQASPQWHFDDATFQRSAAAFDNPDHVAITIDNYRWRIGLSKGEAKYADLEAKLAAFPSIGVPTITMEGDANGAPHPDPSAYAKRFTGKYEHRALAGGIGHNLPQEAPQAFAQAIIDADGF